MPPLAIGALALGGAAIAAGGLGAAFAATGLIGFAANLGASLLLSAASAALMPKPKGPTLSARTVTIREPVVPRDIVYGRVQKGGVIVFLHSTSVNNAVLHLVIPLAGHRVKSIGAVYFDGVMALDADGIPQGRWAGRVGVQKRLGDVGQAPFDALQAVAPELWTLNHRLDGCAAIYINMSYDQDVFPGGIPNIRVDVEGKDDILDPRTGLRIYTDNAALCQADYLSLSPYSLGLGYGAEDGINMASLIEAANICDELVPLPGGGFERRYTCNGVVSLSESPKTIIEAMLTSSAGHLVWQGGDWHLRAGAYRIPTVALSANDIRDQGFSVQTRNSRSTNFNGVRGQFVSPENDWQPDDFPAYASAVYLAEDGGETVWRDISLPFTSSSFMAQRLAKIELEKARRQITVQAPCKLSAWRTAVGETVTLDYARWGFAAKPFFVKQLTLSVQDGRLLPEVLLQETSPLVYEWSASESQIYAAAPRTNLPSAFDVPAPGVPVLSEELYATRNGAAVRVLVRADWSAAPSSFVTRYQVQARRRLNLDGMETGADWIDLGQTEQMFWEIRDVEPGTWDVRVRSVSGLLVRSEYVQATILARGLSTAPAALSGVSIQASGGLAILKWGLPVDLDVRIGGRVVIRHSETTPASWAASTLVEEISGNQTNTVTELLPGAYLLRARDASGILGPESVVFTSAAQAVAFSTVGNLQEDDEFTGAKIGLAEFSGGLQLASGVQFSTIPLVSAVPSVAYPTADVVGQGIYSFASGIDLGSVKSVRLRRSIKIASFRLLDKIGERFGLVSSYESFGGGAGAEADAWVEVQTTLDNPSGSPVWSGWSRIDASEVRARGIRARAILTTSDLSYTPRVTELRLFADEAA